MKRQIHILSFSYEASFSIVKNTSVWYYIIVKELIYTIKKHINSPAKILLFICFSSLYILPLISAIIAERTVDDFCFKKGFACNGYEDTISIITFFSIEIICLIILIISEKKLYLKLDIPDSFFIFSPLVIVFIEMLWSRLNIDIKYDYRFILTADAILLYIPRMGFIKATADIIRAVKIGNLRLIPICLKSDFITFLPVIFYFYN